MSFLVQNLSGSLQEFGLLFLIQLSLLLNAFQPTYNRNLVYIVQHNMKTLCVYHGIKEISNCNIHNTVLYNTLCIPYLQKFQILFHVRPLAQIAVFHFLQLEAV